MAEFLTRRLSSAMMPEDWQKALSQKKPETLFCFDVFRANGQIEMIIRPEQITTPNLSKISYSVDGAPAEMIDVSAIPRGARITLKPTTTTPSKLHLKHGKTDLLLAVNDDETALFDGKNVLFTLTSEPDAEVIADWLDYHCKAQGAEIGLIFLRARPDFDLSRLRKKVEKLTANLADLEALVWVELDIPIGHEEMPAEASRHLAPNAPGRANLGEPEPDPWRSPITEVAILEVARRRFLSKAAAVLYCQPSDLIQTAPDKPNVFERAISGSGFIKFRGHRAYPFALKNPKKPRHGEHSSISFDGGSAENIWCSAPSRLEPNAFWRQFRVTNAAQEDPDEDLTYWRCMAIRHPNLKVSELVAKSSLVRSDDVLSLMKSAFSATPKAPPEAQTTANEPLKNDKILIVTTMKNEGPFLLEWLAYHRAIGVTDFLVYTNDCTDGTDAFFDLLQAKGLLEHRQNPFRTMDMPPQHAAYQDAESSDLAKASDWVICMDVDEYINIHTGDGTLNALFDAVPDATMFALTWRLFGNADITEFKDAPIIEQFNLCAHEIARKPHQAWGFKTLFRNLNHYKKFGVHRPKGLKPEYLDQIKWVNGSGIEMPDKILRSGWRSSIRTVGYDLVSLNHYSLRSAESFLVKRDRGRVNHVDRDQGLAYWFRMNHNGETDASIANKFDRFRTELESLKSDPDILEMHERCVTAHRQRIAELMEAPEYKALYAEITGERLKALSRMLSLFGNQVFLDGPDAVPPDFHLTQKLPR